MRACPARPGLLDWKMKYIWYTGAGKEKENCWKRLMWITTTAQTYKTFKSKMMTSCFSGGEREIYSSFNSFSKESKRYKNILERDNLASASSFGAARLRT